MHTLSLHSNPQQHGNCAQDRGFVHPWQIFDVMFSEHPIGQSLQSFPLKFSHGWHFPLTHPNPGQQFIPADGLQAGGFSQIQIPSFEQQDSVEFHLLPSGQQPFAGQFPSPAGQPSSFGLSTQRYRHLPFSSLQQFWFGSQPYAPAGQHPEPSQASEPGDGHPILLSSTKQLYMQFPNLSKQQPFSSLQPTEFGGQQLS
jgi:hypothetical protein